MDLEGKFICNEVVDEDCSWIFMNRSGLDNIIDNEDYISNKNIIFVGDCFSYEIREKSVKLCF